MDELVHLNRRKLLKATTGFLAGLVIPGGPLARIARGPAWAVDLTSLTSAEGATLLAMARTLMPHDKLDDAAYALVIRAIDADASKDEKLLKTLREGIANLGPDFARNRESTRIDVLKKFESSPFFQTMRLRTVQILYSSSLAYAYFGYEGEAFSKGGYLLRGFNDLRWLPEVPLEDSGPMPVGGDSRGT
jgi:hypothetical protein